MLKSKWSELYYSANELFYEDEILVIKHSAFDEEKFPALKELKDLHQLEVLMLAYSIMQFDTVNDDWVNDLSFGEALYSIFETAGNVELGLQVLIDKGWLIGKSDSNWKQHNYDLDLKKLVDDGLLSSCARPEVSEEEILPIEFRPYESFNEKKSLKDIWKSLCYQIYQYSQKQYDWVVYKNLEQLCLVFMNMWKLYYAELRVLAMIDHFNHDPFTKEQLVERFHKDESKEIEQNFEGLLVKQLVKFIGINKDEEYEFEIGDQVENDLTTQRLHYNEEQKVYFLCSSAMDVQHWKKYHFKQLKYLTENENSGAVEVDDKEYPAIRYLHDFTALQSMVLAWLIMHPILMVEKDGAKLINLEELTHYSWEHCEKYDCKQPFRSVWNNEECIELLKGIEEQHWITILSSTFGFDNYIKVNIRNLVWDGLLLKR